MKKLPLFALALSTSLAAIDAAYAQIEEIVVTTRKREENLQNVPIVVTAFTAAGIERKGIEDLNDIAKYTPGLFLDEGINIQDTRVVIRGLSPTRGRQNVAILQDDVDISSLAYGTAGGSFVINPRLLDIERIEVIKGPHSALYGRSAFNGAINYITKKPGDKFEGNVQADVGTHGKAEGRFTVMGPVVADKLSLGLNGEIWNFNGYYKSPITGHGLSGGYGKGVAVTAVATPNDWLRANWRTEWSKDHFDPEARTFLDPVLVPVPAVALAAVNGLPPVVTAAVAAVPANAFYPQTFGSMGDISKWQRPAPSTNPRTGTDYFGSEREIFRNTLRLEATTEFATLTSITHYGDNKQFQYNDALSVGDLASPAVNGGQETYTDSKIKLVTQEVRIQSNSEGRFKWTVGGLYWDELLKQSGRSLRCASTSGGCAAVFAAVGNTFSVPPNVTKRDTRHLSGYAHVEFSITPKLKASAEVRYTTETEKTTGPAATSPTTLGCPSVAVAGRTTAANGAVTCVAPGAQISGPLTATGFIKVAVDSKFWTPRFTLDYKVTEDALAFVSVAQGKKPGGLSALGGLGSPVTNTYEPEVIWVYEAGAKTGWMDNRLQINGAAYYQDFGKKQVSITFVDPTTVPPNQLNTRVVNAAKATVKGFELEMNAAPTEHLTLNLAYTYNDAKYKNFVDINTGVSAISRAAINKPNVCTVVVVQGANRCQLDYSGNQLEGSAKHQLLVGGELRGDLTADLTWFIDADARYTSKRFTSFENSMYMDPYWIMDLRIGARAEQWTITAYMDNVFDDTTIRASGVYLQNWNYAYLTATGRTPISAQAPSGLSASFPERRLVGIRGSYNF